MPKPAEKVQMSSIVPWRLIRRLAPRVERRLSLRRWDQFYQFWVQTRLLFSRSIVLLAVAQFVFFAWTTIANNVYKVAEVNGVLSVQAILLAIVLHMGLWEVEREGRTFELLLMRIPSLNRLIWFKLRVSIIWSVILVLPFYLAYAWFVGIPYLTLLLIMLFCQTTALAAVFITCIVSSFIHHGLATALVTIVVLYILAIVFLAGHLPYVDRFNPFIAPTEFIARPDVNGWLAVKTLTINRLVLAGTIVLLYRWFRHRLSKIEKWI